LFFNIWNHIPSSPPPFDWISFVVSISKIYLFYFQNSEKKRISVIYRHNPHLSHFQFQNIFTPRSVLYVWTMDHSDTVFFSPPRKTLYIYIYIHIYIYIYIYIYKTRSLITDRCFAMAASPWTEFLNKKTWTTWCQELENRSVIR
jgi:hypothetical protein